MRDDELHARAHGFGHDRRRHRQAGEHALDVGTRVAHDQADVVPLRRQLQRREAIQVLGKIGDGRHERLSVCASACK